jgi:phage gp37-like protein
MDNDTEQALAERCREAFGDHLRVAFWYSTDDGSVDWETLHFHEDVRDAWAGADDARDRAAELVVSHNSAAAVDQYGFVTDAHSLLTDEVSP